MVVDIAGDNVSIIPTLVILAGIVWLFAGLTACFVRSEKQAANYWRKKWEQTDNNVDKLLRSAQLESTARYDHLRPMNDETYVPSSHLLRPSACVSASDPEKQIIAAGVPIARSE